MRLPEHRATRRPSPAESEPSAADHLAGLSAKNLIL
jgi:hypothetical protein